MHRRLPFSTWHFSANDEGASVAQLALAWLLHQSAVSWGTIGATKMTLLKDSLRAVGVTFTPEELHQLTSVSQLPPEYSARILAYSCCDQVA
jgi:aryl-alcohol dehydrogenase-like predicted oxidoreductase